METETLKEQYPDLLEAILPKPTRTVYTLRDFVEACAEMDPIKRVPRRSGPPPRRYLHQTLKSADRYSLRTVKRRVRLRKSATFEERWLAFYDIGVVVEKVENGGYEY